MALGAWLAWRWAGDAPATPSPAAASPSAAGGAPAAVQPADPAASDDTHEPTAERTVAPPTEPAQAIRLATIVGRCCDARGAPLAGCTIEVHGRCLDQAAADPWLLDHPDAVDWRAPDPVTSKADGRFAVTFWPPEPWSFDLRISRAGLVAQGAHWQHLAEGSQTDVGDVALRPGVKVTGQVFDPEGRPFGPARLTLLVREPRGSAVVTTTWGTACDVGEDGTFATRDPLPPGPCEVRLTCQHRPVTAVRPDRIEVGTADPTTCTLLAVSILPTAPPDNPLDIRGRVVDDADGTPLRALVREENDRVANPQGCDQDGTFRLEHRGFSGAQAKLQVEAKGYEPLAEPAVVAWGSRDVELRLAHGADLTLRITDEQGQPVERYHARLDACRAIQSIGTGRDPLDRMLHRDGEVTLPGFARGDWLLAVEFPTASGLAPLFEHLVQSTAGPRRIERTAHPMAERRLRVADANGPVAGVTVQLCEPFGKPLDQRRNILPHSAWTYRPDGRDALVLSEYATDDAGTIVLRGPGGHDLALCLPGPGHEPRLVNGVRLDEPDDLVVRIQRGARLVGRALPTVTWNELRAAEPGRELPFLELSGPRGRFPTSQQVGKAMARLRLAPDGSFEFACLPAGTWRIELVDMPGLPPMSRLPCGSIELVDGATCHRDLDLGAARAESARAVEERRKPVPSGMVRITVRDAQQRPVPDVALQFEVAGQRDFAPPTDAEGRALATVRAGAARIVVLPKALTTREAFARMVEEAREQGAGDFFTGHVLLVGTCTVLADHTLELTLQLPATAGY